MFCRAGFTAVESLISLAVSVFLLAGLLSVFVICNRYWHITSLDMSTTRGGSSCLQQMVYGVGTNIGLRGAYWVTNSGTATNWALQSSNYYGRISYTYSPASKTVVFSNATSSRVIGTNIVASQVTNTAFGLSISVTLQQTDGRFTEGNTLSTYVKLRAPKQQ